MQDQVCIYLAKIKGETKNNFSIGDEVKRNNDSSRYFKISYSEIRTDQLFVQITPMLCLREGYLKVDEDGTISLTDINFNHYRSSNIFYFDSTKNVLKSRADDELEMQERTSSQCIKGLCTVGLFALAATTLYCAADADIGFEL